MEFQLLYGMAAPLARALTERGERVRIYMPFGDLIPGMGYLVRRLLENTSNESFLRQGFARGEPPEALLAGPASATSPPAQKLEPVRVFTNEPRADFTLTSEREKLATALRAVRGAFGKFYPLVIGGKTVETREHLVSVNPSRPDEVVARTASALAEDVDRAVAAAVRAFPEWRDAGVVERARVLGAVAGLLRQQRAELAAWIVYEAGKPWPEADSDVAEAIDFVEYYRREALALQEPRRLGDLRGEVNHYLREPRGVVGVIAPWNFPLAILTGMTSAALATGNSVVMKPAEQTPVIAAKLMAIFEQAGLPPGVVNYAPGGGEIAGDRLVRHPDVALIAFTGSQEVGTAIYAAAAQRVPGARQLKRVVTEMGGKNAIIVDDDADLDEAVQGIVASAFGYSGQKCSACSRVIAVGHVYERLIERLVEAARTLPMGPADAPGTIVGPVIDAVSMKRIHGYISLGAQLARPVLIRDLPQDLAALGGYYIPPVIFAGVPPGSPLAREEIFGPVLSLMPAKSFREAIEIAMSVDFALTGGVFSRSPVHLAEARGTFRVGNLYLNRAITSAMVGRQPFGGRQLSGLGCQAGGPDYLIQFIETRVVTENTLRRGFASGELA
jgi:RHH-type proline utilization regulon transcriptional repressor/proline dehydrogenase/delta 1-pyrroline-5-carboxylate dehydrogenase